MMIGDIIPCSATGAGVIEPMATKVTALMEDAGGNYIGFIGEFIEGPQDGLEITVLAKNDTEDEE